MVYRIWNYHAESPFTISPDTRWYIRASVIPSNSKLSRYHAPMDAWSNGVVPNMRGSVTFDVHFENRVHFTQRWTIHQTGIEWLKIEMSSLSPGPYQDCYITSVRLTSLPLLRWVDYVCNHLSNTADITNTGQSDSPNNIPRRTFPIVTFNGCARGH